MFNYLEKNNIIFFSKTVGNYNLLVIRHGERNSSQRHSKKSCYRSIITIYIIVILYSAKGKHTCCGLNLMHGHSRPEQRGDWQIAASSCMHSRQWGGYHGSDTCNGAVRASWVYYCDPVSKRVALSECIGPCWPTS